MITRVSLLPFDLGGNTEKDLQNAIAASGFKESQLTQTDKQLLGLDISRWKNNDNNGADTRLYLQRDGFAIFVYRKKTKACFSNHESVAKLLLRRQQLHQEILSKKHHLAKKVECVRQQVESRVGKRARQPLHDGVPYVFTFFVDEEYATSNDIEDVTLPVQGLIPCTHEHMSVRLLIARFRRMLRGLIPCTHEQVPVVPKPLQKASTAALQGIVALFDPSRIGLDNSDIDTSLTGKLVDINTVKGRIGELDYDDMMPPNLDLSNKVYSGATRDSLVIIGVDGETGSSIHTYELLEVRTQIAWMTADLVRKWCEQVHERGGKPDPYVEWFQFDQILRRTVPLFRRTSHLSDVRMSSRNVEILKRLTATSELEQQIEVAEDAIQWTFKALERFEDRNNQTLQRTLTLIIIVFALLQLIPEQIPEPEQIPDMWLPQFFVACNFIFLFVFFGYYAFYMLRRYFKTRHPLY